MENHHFEHEGQYKREMTSRHLQMLSIGGVIGTGLFLSSGYTIAQAGPLGLFFLLIWRCHGLFGHVFLGRIIRSHASHRIFSYLCYPIY